MPQATVVVVGAGASGLSAAGALHRRGIEAVVLEQDERLGGTWTRRYDRLRLHTVRGFSGLAHYRIPRRYSSYLSRDEYAAYLAEYARHFPLRVMTGHPVHKIRMDPDAQATWTVATTGGDWHCRAVVIATGQYRIPILPKWPGHESFDGHLVHSARYTTGSAYAGKRVLVVGAGNSGTEIATDLVENGASYVALSIRTPPPIVPRDPFGLPVQRTGILLSFLPATIADRIGRLTSRLVFGDLTSHGLPRPAWSPYSARRVPVIDVGFVNVLKRGLVHIRPALIRLTSEGAVFQGGSAESFDTIIAATGFSTGLNELLDTSDAEEVLDASHEPIDRSGHPTARPGLFFMGYIHSLRGHLFEANLASRRLAKNVGQYLEQGA
ncbi:MAG: flavin-containing monooxygenase [Gemmatimonadaceae bacterium]